MGRESVLHFFDGLNVYVEGKRKYFRIVCMKTHEEWVYKIHGAVKFMECKKQNKIFFLSFKKNDDSSVHIKLHTIDMETKKCNKSDVVLVMPYSYYDSSGRYFCGYEQIKLYPTYNGDKMIALCWDDSAVEIDIDNLEISHLLKLKMNKDYLCSNNIINTKACQDSTWCRTGEFTFECIL